MDDTGRREALADFLRTRRARLSPEDVGLARGARRRTPGLRREEVAQLASIGTSWYVALEQGRDVRPSDAVLDSVASALRLSPAERDHLHLLARRALTGDSPPQETLGYALEQSIMAMLPHPAYVLGRRWDLLAWNSAAELVFSFSEIAPPHTRNYLWRTFTHPALRRNPQWETLARSLTAQFRAVSAHYPDDPGFSELVADLRRMSEEFRLWWSSHDVRVAADGHKTMHHPVLGTLEFEHVTLGVPGAPDQQVVILTCVGTTTQQLAVALGI